MPYMEPILSIYRYAAATRWPWTNNQMLKEELQETQTHSRFLQSATLCVFLEHQHLPLQVIESYGTKCIYAMVFLPIIYSSFSNRWQNELCFCWCSPKRADNSRCANTKVCTLAHTENNWKASSPQYLLGWTTEPVAEPSNKCQHLRETANNVFKMLNGW